MVKWSRKPSFGRRTTGDRAPLQTATREVRLPKGTRPRLFQLPLLPLTEGFRPCYYCSGHYRRKCAPNHDVRVVLPRNDAPPTAKSLWNPRGCRAPGLFRRRTARKVPMRQEQPESTSLRPFVAPDSAPRHPRPHRLAVRFGGRVWLRMRLDRSSVRVISQSPRLRRFSMQWGVGNAPISKRQHVRLARGEIKLPNADNECVLCSLASFA